MAFQTKKTVLALVLEVTEGTPVSPTAGTDFIALQDGFDLEPAFDVLENAELTGSIGTAKPILGFENPAVTLSHYIRHSGVEGTEPGFGLLLQGAFGAKAIRATERDTVAGSSAGTALARAILNVDAGEGVEFQRGDAVLIKDATNGFEIRNIFSISVDALSLGNNLAVAPASGVNLGKNVLYLPGEAHPSMSVWNYRANEALIEMISGAKVTEMVIEVEAGQLVNGAFSLEGIKFHWDPIEIDATNNLLDFTDDTGTFQATIPSKFYVDPIELAAAIETAMDAVAGDEITVTYDSIEGKFTIASDGAVTFSLLWNTGAGTATNIGTTIAFDVVADDTGAFTYTSDNRIDLTAEFTPVFDAADPLVAKNNEVFLGGFNDFVCFSTQSMTFTLGDEKTDVIDVCAESGKSGTLITGRTVTIDMVANIPQYDADKFKRFRTNEETQLTFNFGEKVAGNWVAGKSANIYLPTGTISSIKAADNDGLVTIEMTITAFVKSSLGEFYLNFL